MNKNLINTFASIGLLLFGNVFSEDKGVAYNSWNESLKEEMQNKINDLTPDSSFTYVDLGLSDEELLIIDNIKIESSHAYNRFGDLHLLKEELPIYLRTLGKNDENLIQILTEIILRTALNVKDAAQKESAWVCVRATMPNHAFDMPRWHSDGSYFLPYDEFVFKFAAALKGSPTLFYKLPHEMRDEFNLNMDNRAYLNELLDVNKSESPPKGFGAFFIVADHKFGAIHSEPPMNETRLFFSILPGNTTQIEELYLRWHK